ncbi:MAG: glycosyltransferase, partial [Acidobacteriota bacterium]
MTADATPLDDDPPLVSVVMPVRNESRFIARSLGAVLRQDWPRLEVVIADGGSTDDTRAQIAALAAQHPRVPVIVIDNPAGIVAPGLNRAIRRSRGAIVVRVDGHTEIATDYVRCCVAALASTGADNVGGRMDAVAASTPWGRAIADATS